jgi:hypothetical protein
VLAQRRELNALAGRLGEWALLLKLVNGFLLDRVAKLGRALRRSLPITTGMASVNYKTSSEGRYG